jgi:hypothetical protein
MEYPFYTMWTNEERAELISRGRLLLNWEIELAVREVERFPTEEGMEQLFFLCNIYVKSHHKRTQDVWWSDTEDKPWECHQPRAKNSESQSCDGTA